VSRFAAFLSRLRDYGQADCLVCDGRTHSYAELLAACDAAGARLDATGIEPGTVVALRADYSLGSIAALFALLKARAVVAMLPRGGDARSLAAQAHATGQLDIDDSGRWNWTAAGPQQQHPLLEQLREAGDAGILLFTSGSTGAPKAALQSLERFLHKFRKPGKRHRTLAFLLFDHVAGLDTLFYTLASGGVVIVTRSRAPDDVCRLIAQARVEVLSASPSFLRLLCLAGDVSDADLSSLRVITYGSEPMDPATLSLLNARFPDCQIRQKYGTTETGSPPSASRGNDSLWLKIGGDGVETRVVDDVLHIRSESTILGYLNAPSPVDEQGWYCTGDLVEVDGEWIRFRGRASDRINVGGEKVSPTEVEQVILELDIVREVVVRGEPNHLLGNIVTAQVVLATDLDEGEAARAVRTHCRSRLAAYKVPVKIDFVAGRLTSDRQKALRKPGFPPAQ
jgi:acyl-CoA synthetase (AMP-forming)/AMP-acid ligase II